MAIHKRGKIKPLAEQSVKLNPKVRQRLARNFFEGLAKTRQIDFARRLGAITNKEPLAVQLVLELEHNLKNGGQDVSGLRSLLKPKIIAATKEFLQVENLQTRQMLRKEVLLQGIEKTFEQKEDLVAFIKKRQAELRQELKKNQECAQLLNELELRQKNKRKREAAKHAQRKKARKAQAS